MGTALVLWIGSGSKLLGFLALIGTALSAIALWGRSLFFAFIIFVGGACVGLWRGSLQQQSMHDAIKYVGSIVHVRGVVSEDSDTSKPGLTSITLKDLVINGVGQSGSIRASIATTQSILRGNVVEIEEELLAGDATKVGYMYRGKLVKLEDPYPGDLARRIRDWFATSVRKAVPDPQASLGIGYLVGQKSALPPDLLEALQIAGLTHIVVASGYNLTILVRLCRRILSKVSKFAALIGSSMLVVCMISITGLSPSMTRAGLVTALSLITWYYGRNFHPLTLLPIAAAITIAIQPEYAWGDIGWLLSFTAFAGVMILAPLLQRFFFGDSPPGTIRQVLGETVSAHILTLPIVVATFSAVSNVAIFANMMIVPLVPLAMLLTFLSGLGSLALPFAASVIGYPATWLLTYMTATAQWWSELPWSQSEIVFGWHLVVIAYVAIILLIAVLVRKTRYSFRQTNILD